MLKNIFKHKERGEPSKLSKDNLQIYSFSQAVTIVGTSSDLKMDKGQDEEMDKG